MLSFTELAVDVAEADAYADLRAWTNWTGDEAAKEAALRRGQDYIAGLYNARWNAVWDNDDAPEVVKFAIIEAARRELVSPGSLSPDVTPNSIKTRVRVEGAVDVTYANGGAAGQLPRIMAIDGLLSGILAPLGGGINFAITRA